MEDTKIKEICVIAKINDIGDLSDGFHTFNQLYHQRAVLFATIVNQNTDKSWKSLKHEDGQYCFDSNGNGLLLVLILHKVAIHTIMKRKSIGICSNVNH